MYHTLDWKFMQLMIITFYQADIHNPQGASLIQLNLQLHDHFYLFFRIYSQHILNIIRHLPRHLKLLRNPRMPRRSHTISFE